MTIRNGLKRVMSVNGGFEQHYIWMRAIMRIEWLRMKETKVTTYINNLYFSSWWLSHKNLIVKCVFLRFIWVKNKVCCENLLKSDKKVNITMSQKMSFKVKSNESWALTSELSRSRKELLNKLYRVFEGEGKNRFETGHMSCSVELIFLSSLQESKLIQSWTWQSSK